MCISHRLLGCAAWLGLILGCHSGAKPIALGPVFRFEPTSKVNAPSAPPCTVVDGRPAWEKRYYAGTWDTATPSAAVTFLALENLDPMPAEFLAHELAQRTAQLGDPPARLEVTLQSFRVVVNQIRAVEAEAEAERREREEERDDDDVNPFVQLVADAVFGLLSYEIRETARGIKDSISRERVLRGPPTQVLRNCSPDVTCEIAASVRMVWPDGRDHRVRVQSQRNSILFAPDGVGRNYRRWVAPVVDTTIRDVAAQVRTDTEQWLYEDVVAAANVGGAL